MFPVILIAILLLLAAFTLLVRRLRSGTLCTESFECVTFTRKGGTAPGICYLPKLYIDETVLASMTRPSNVEVPPGYMVQLFGKPDKFWSSTAPSAEWDGSFPIQQASVVKSDVVGSPAASTSQPPHALDPAEIDPFATLGAGPWHSYADIAAPSIILPLFTDKTQDHPPPPLSSSSIDPPEPMKTPTFWSEQ